MAWPVGSVTDWYSARSSLSCLQQFLFGRLLHSGIHRYNNLHARLAVCWLQYLHLLRLFAPYTPLSAIRSLLLSRQLAPYRSQHFALRRNTRMLPEP
jgi:hypothetical protein